MAHKKLGHLWGEKTLGMINKYFVWSGMSKDVFTHSRECGQCQVKSSIVPRKAPTVDRPLLTELFENVAFDLVGPLPKGKGDCMYLLTYVCMATAANTGSIRGILVAVTNTCPRRERSAQKFRCLAAISYRADYKITDVLPRVDQCFTGKYTCSIGDMKYSNFLFYFKCLSRINCPEHH